MPGNYVAEVTSQKSEQVFMVEDEDGDTGIPDNDVQKRIDEAIAGLKKINADLRSEKKELKDLSDAMTAQLEKFGGDEGIDALVKMLESLKNDKVGKLIGVRQLQRVV